LKSLEETQKTVTQINRITRGLPKLGKIGTAETPWILAVLLTRCDQETVDLWQLMTSKDKYSVESFLEFAEKRIRGEKENKVSIYNTAQVPSIRKMSCTLCRKPHALHGCKEFREKGARDRRQFVSSRSGVCFNCLSTQHQVAECPDERRCSHCEGKHHTLIHQPKQTETLINLTTEEALSE
jgi:hypothetical protein